MNSGTGGRDDFGVSDSFPSSRGFARARSMSSSFLGGMGPFDDHPFFTDPFSAFPFRGFMGPSIFGNSIFGPHRNPFRDGSNFEFLEDQPLQQHRPSGPIIEELSDDVDETSKEHEDPEKILRSGKEAYVQDPIEKSRVAGVKEHKKYQNVPRKAFVGEPQTSKYTFHSSTTRCGGINGTYYTSSTTRRMGGDGVVVEESKEADTSLGRATHRVSRGIHEKGHSFTRRLNPDGRVDTMQTLHNLNQDELPGFEAAWKGNAGETLMGWNPEIKMHRNENMRRNNNSNRSGRSSKVIDIEFLPSTADHVEGRALYAAEADRIRNWAENRARFSFTDAMEMYTENAWVSVFSLSVVCAFIILSSSSNSVHGT